MTNLKLKAEPTTYAEAMEFLAGKGTRQLGYATHVAVTHDGVGIVHHGTVIIDYHADGSITLNNGGWASKTTAHRMHLLTPVGVRVNLRRESILVNGEPMPHGGPVTLTPAELDVLAARHAERVAQLDAEWAAKLAGMGVAR